MSSMTEYYEKWQVAACEGVIEALKRRFLCILAELVECC
jgi:hypothetical protein